MPMMRFAAMGRTDQSMRPPRRRSRSLMGSPNAWICATQQDAAWSETGSVNGIRAIPGPGHGTCVADRDGPRKGDWKRLPTCLENRQPRGKRDLEGFAGAAGSQLPGRVEMARAAEPSEKRSPWSVPLPRRP